MHDNLTFFTSSSQVVDRDPGHSDEGQSLRRTEGRVHQAEGGDGETQDSHTEDPGDAGED